MGSIFAVNAGNVQNGALGAAGNNFVAGAADIDKPTTVDQANTAYGASQDALNQQQNFLNAVQGQNGLGNQSNIYNQLGNVAAGKGPNPAQAMLAQQTAANTANQAALMAGQRGAGANSGLLARQIAMQGAANQQQAAGQGATMQANQSLNALNQQGQMASQMVGNQAQATQGMLQGTQGEQGQILGGIQGQNNAAVGMQTSENTANSGIAQGAQQGQNSLLGGTMNGIGGMFAANGGQVPHMAAGGMPTQAGVPQDDLDKTIDALYVKLANGGPAAPSAPSSSAPASTFGKFLNGMSSSMSPQAANPNARPLSPNQQGGDAIGKLPITIAKSAYNYFNPSTPPPSAVGSPGQLPGTSTVPAGTTTNGIMPGEGSYQTPDEAWQPVDDSAATDAASDTAGEEAATDAAAEEGATDAAAEDAAAEGATSAAAEDAAVEGLATAALSKGGKVPAMLSPGERYLSPKAVAKVAKGADPIKAGKKVPGKPKVGGSKNDYANDTVPATLEEGGIVLPRSVTQAKHPHWAAHQFVSQIMAKNKGKLK